MPRARTSAKHTRQTAASTNGSGCSFYSLSLLAVLLISCLLTGLSLNTTRSIHQEHNTSTNISPIFTREVQYWSDDILRWANASSLDPDLVAVIMQIESCGNPFARSSAGATGLFQVMPFHFGSNEDPYDPETNAVRGLSYLSRSLEASHGNIRLALAGYNGGIGLIARGEWMWPAETIRYVHYGTPIYEDARAGVSSSRYLDEWHQKFGSALCRQARKNLGIK